METAIKFYSRNEVIAVVNSKARGFNHADSKAAQLADSLGADQWEILYNVAIPGAPLLVRKNFTDRLVLKATN